MTPRITTAEFRALYGDKAPTLAPAKSRRPSRTISGPYHTRCTTCGEYFTAQARQERHMTLKHYRYEVVL